MSTPKQLSILPEYWDKMLKETLYPNLFFYQFGTKRTLRVANPFQELNDYLSETLKGPADV